jgi:hypothetical protein
MSYKIRGEDSGSPHAGLETTNEVPSQALELHILDIPRHVADPIEAQARYIFLNEAVLLTPDSVETSKGHFAHLLSLLRRSNLNALEAALNAVALILLVNRFGIVKARPLALTQYAACIRQLQDQNVVANTSTRDLLACTSLLSIYEVGHRS